MEGWGRVGGGGWRGRGGDDDDIGTEQYLHKSRFTWYLQYFRDGGPSYMMMVDDGDDDDA